MRHPGIRSIGFRERAGRYLAGLPASCDTFRRALRLPDEVVSISARPVRQISPSVLIQERSRPRPLARMIVVAIAFLAVSSLQARGSNLGLVASTIGATGGYAESTSSDATVLLPACSRVNLRVGASLRSRVTLSLGFESWVTVSGTTTGSAWRTTCPTIKAGTGWYVITQINGQSVDSLYGVTVLYAAAGVLTSPTLPSLTAAPSPPETASPSPEVTLAPSPQATQTPTAAITAAPSVNGTPALTPAPAIVGASNETSGFTFALAVLGWLLALALVLLLVLLRRRRGSDGRTGRGIPSNMELELSRALESMRQSEIGVGAAALSSDNARQEAEKTRQEFGILRAELQDRMDEVKAMKLGTDFHVRRPLLLALARVATMISGDRAAGISADETLRGVLVELEEVMDDQRIRTVTPTVGGSLDQLGIDMRTASFVPTNEGDSVGTVAAVDQPALIYQGPSEQEVLIPARVRIYREGAD